MFIYSALLLFVYREKCSDVPWVCVWEKSRCAVFIFIQWKQQWPITDWNLSTYTNINHPHTIHSEPHHCTYITTSSQMCFLLMEMWCIDKYTHIGDRNLLMCIKRSHYASMKVRPITFCELPRHFCECSWLILWDFCLYSNTMEVNGIVFVVHTTLNKYD